MSQRLTTAAAAEVLLKLPQTTPEPLETPSTSFKLKFGKNKYTFKPKPTTPGTTTAVTTEEPVIETEEVEPSSTRRPFPIKKFLRRLKAKSILAKTTTTTTTTEEPAPEQETQDEPEQENNNHQADESQTQEESRAPIHINVPRAGPRRFTTSTTTTTTEVTLL